MGSYIDDGITIEEATKNGPLSDGFDLGLLSSRELALCWYACQNRSTPTAWTDKIENAVPGILADRGNLRLLLHPTALHLS